MYLIPIVVLLALAWIFLVVPQRRRQRAQAQLLEGLEPGDEVLTSGGLLGHVRAVGEDDVTIEVAPGTDVRVIRRAVVGVLHPDEPEQPGEPPPASQAHG